MRKQRHVQKGDVDQQCQVNLAEGGDNKDRSCQYQRQEASVQTETTKVPSSLRVAVAAAPTAKHKQIIGEALFAAVAATYPQMAKSITGVLLVQSNGVLFGILQSEQLLQRHIQQALQFLQVESEADKHSKLVLERLHMKAAKNFQAHAHQVTQHLLHLYQHALASLDEDDECFVQTCNVSARGLSIPCPKQAIQGRFVRWHQNEIKCHHGAVQKLTSSAREERAKLTTQQLADASPLVVVLEDGYVTPCPKHAPVQSVHPQGRTTQFLPTQQLPR